MENPPIKNGKPPFLWTIYTMAMLVIARGYIKKSDFTNQSQSMLLSNDLSIFRIIETRKIQSIYALVNKHSF